MLVGEVLGVETDLSNFPGGLDVPCLDMSESDDVDGLKGFMLGEILD